MVHEYLIVRNKDNEFEVIEIDFENPYTYLDEYRAKGYSLVVINNIRMIDIVRYFIIVEGYNLVDLDVKFALDKSIDEYDTYMCSTTENYLTQLAYVETGKDFILTVFLSKVGCAFRVSVEGLIECFGDKEQVDDVVSVIQALLNARS